MLAEFERGRSVARKMVKENKKQALFMREVLKMEREISEQEQVVINDYWLKEGFLQEINAQENLI